MKNIPNTWLLVFAVIIFVCFYLFGHTPFISPRTARDLYIAGGILSAGLIIYAVVRTYFRARKD